MFTKPIDEITFDDVESFCKEWPEGVRVEYKREVKEIKGKIPKIVSSFANFYGGIFFIGVEADKTKNEVIFPIQGIPPGTPAETHGIEERIQQSALRGIYPGVMPEVKIVDVPNSENFVVVVRVDESIQAPHAIENSTQIYIRTGSTTEPYDLAEIDRISHMLKRREDSQVVVQQILNRIEARVARYFRLPHRSEDNVITKLPDITIIAQPVFPYRPVISTSNIYELRYVLPPPIRRVTGGFFHRTREEYLELNEYGIVYHNIPLSNSYAQEIDYTRFLSHINDSIVKIRDLYKKCEYLGNIEVTARLQDVLEKQLMDPDGEYSGRLSIGTISGGTKCYDTEVVASNQCLARDLENEEKRKDIVEELVCQLLWAFNIPADQPNIREGVRELIR